MSDHNAAVANLIATRGNRTSATLLGWMEDHVYEYLPEHVQEKLRRVVLDQINGFKDLAIDIVKSDAAVINEVWVQQLRSIHDDVQAIRREVNNG